MKFSEPHKQNVCSRVHSMKTSCHQNWTQIKEKKCEMWLEKCDKKNIRSQQSYSLVCVHEFPSETFKWCFN